MAPEFSKEDKDFIAGFMDDYYTDCDEHLTLARRHIIAIEECIKSGKPTRLIIDELFRSFHTIKGLAGMVGHQQAEELAHQLENILRLVRNNKLTLTNQIANCIHDGIALLEKTINAYRNATTLPDPINVINQLSQIIDTASKQNAEKSNTSIPTETTLSTQPLAVLSNEQHQRIIQLQQKGWRCWKIRYQPSHELVERGVNIEKIRTRLTNIGEIIQATPTFTTDGKLIFEFLLVSPESEEKFSTWSADGVSWSLFDPKTIVKENLPQEAQQVAIQPGQLTENQEQLNIQKNITPSKILRVELTKLEDLMWKLGEMVTARARLQDQLNELEGKLPVNDWQKLQESSQSLEYHLRDLRESIMRLRLVPIGDVFERLSFAIMDLSRELKKDVKILISGKDTEIDKIVVDKMLDPLLHIVRNSVSHGIEPPDIRSKHNKSTIGTVSLRAFTSGNAVIIEIEDDGAGVNIKKVREKAKAIGLISDNTELDDQALLNIICSPGFSTKDEADKTSGRGMGMSIVKKTVEEFGGILSLTNKPGAGTKFTITLPTTLMIVDALIIEIGKVQLAAPLPSIREVVYLNNSEIFQIQQLETIRYRNNVIPLVNLAKFFKIKDTPRQNYNVIVAGSDDNYIGIKINRIISQREIVVRPLVDPLIQTPGLAGATETTDGHAMLILDIDAIVKLATKTLLPKSKLIAPEYANK